MTEFAYNNAKNTNTGHTFFELNCDFYLWTSYKKDIDPCFQSKSVNKLANEFKELITICRKNLKYV